MKKDNTKRKKKKRKKEKRKKEKKKEGKKVLSNAKLRRTRKGEHFGPI